MDRPVTASMAQQVDFRGEIIDIRLSEDPDGVIFHAHKELLLLAQSEYFQDAFSSYEYEYPDSIVVGLEGCTPDIFNVYLNWIYRRHIAVDRCERTREAGDAEYNDLAKAYVLGDGLMDVRFKVAVIDTMKSKAITRKSSFFLLPAEAITCVYSKTLEGSPMRRLMVGVFAFIGTRVTFATAPSLLKDVPREFVEDLARNLTAFRHSTEPFPSHVCQYHCHKNQNDCYKSALSTSEASSTTMTARSA